MVTDHVGMVFGWGQRCDGHKMELNYGQTVRTKCNT